jgi:hypothetical protein
MFSTSPRPPAFSPSQYKARSRACIGEILLDNGLIKWTLAWRGNIAVPSEQTFLGFEAFGKEVQMNGKCRIAKSAVYVLSGTLVYIEPLL